MATLNYNIEAVNGVQTLLYLMIIFLFFSARLFAEAICRKGTCIFEIEVTEYKSQNRFSRWKKKVHVFSQIT